MADNSFDAITVGFGVRNFTDIKKGMSEIYRVLEPAAATVFPFKQLYGFYFAKILPFIGKLISKDKRAYKYLPESVAAFAHGKVFLSLCQEIGFRHARRIHLTWGICSLYLAEKPKLNSHLVKVIRKSI